MSIETRKQEVIKKLAAVQDVLTTQPLNRRALIWARVDVENAIEDLLSELNSIDSARFAAALQQKLLCAINGGRL